MQTTNRDKIMVHLLEHHCIQEYPATHYATQHGIADNTGILRSHVPRTVKKLILKKLVEEKIEHVKGLERKRKVYKLTPEGIFHARDIQEKIMNTKIRFRNKKGIVKEMRVCEILNKLKKTDISILDIAIHLKDGVVDYKDIVRKGKTIDFTENAPRPIHFYGREKEIQQIENFLKEKRKIITVYGMAGIGKSVLLSKIIEEYRGRKNIFYYNIHEWSTLRSILESFSDFLQKMGKRKMRSYLKSKPDTNLSEIGIILEEEPRDSNSLIVFDDTQKADKEIINLFEFLREILPKTNTTLIVAGRKKLGFYDARHILNRTVGEIRINGLDKESSRKLLRKDIEEKDFEKIYSLTKGHPMALELIGKGLEKQKDIMKYVYNEVFSKLTTQEKQLMFFISVFNKPVPVDMLLKHNFNYENIQELIKKSLLLENSSEIVHPHDLLTEFFYSKMPMNLKIRNHRKAAGYYEKKKGDIDIIMAMYHYLKADNQKDAVKIVVKNGEKLINKGYTDETMNILRELDEKKIQKHELPKILLLKGNTYSLKGELNNAIDSYRRSLKLCEKIKDSIGTAESYLKISDIYWMKSEWDVALDNFNRVLNISKKINNSELTAEGYHGLGKTYWRKGELDVAEKYFNLCFKHTVDNDLLLAKNYTGLGTINMDQGRYDTAITLYNKALKYFDKIGKKYETIRIYNNLAVTYARKKDYNMAVEYHEKQISLAETLGDFRGMAYGLIGVSGDYAELGRLKDAFDCCKKGLSLAERLDEKLLISLGHNNMGVILGKKTMWKEAIVYFNTSIRIAKGIESTTRLADACFDFAKMLKTKGDTVNAKTQYRNALKYYEKLGNKVKIKDIRDVLTILEKKA